MGILEICFNSSIVLIIPLYSLTLKTYPKTLKSIFYLLWFKSHYEGHGSRSWFKVQGHGHLEDSVWQFHRIPWPWKPIPICWNHLFMCPGSKVICFDKNMSVRKLSIFAFITFLWKFGRIDFSFLFSYGLMGHPR